VRPSNYGQSATPSSEYSVNSSSARPPALPQEYLARQHYAQQQNHAGAGTMAQATSPSMSLQDGQQNNHHNPPHKSNPEVPIDPSIAQSSPTYPPYSPYAPNHDMSQYQGHPQQGYHPWPQQYQGHPHGMPGGPYSSPGTAVSAGGAAATAGPRPGQVDSLFLTLCRALYLATLRILTLCLRSTPSSPFPVLSRTSALAAAMKRLSGCINAGGKDARRHMVH
jgi:hypothetical protein